MILDKYLKNGNFDYKRFSHDVFLDIILQDNHNDSDKISVTEVNISADSLNFIVWVKDGGNLTTKLLVTVDIDDRELLVYNPHRSEVYASFKYSVICTGLFDSRLSDKSKEHIEKYASEGKFHYAVLDNQYAMNKDATPSRFSAFGDSPSIIADKIVKGAKHIASLLHSYNQTCYQNVLV